VVVDPALVPGRGEPAAYEGLQRFPLSFFFPGCRGVRAA